MGASEHLKAAIKAKKFSQAVLAQGLNKPKQTIYNALNRDTFTFSMAEQYAEVMGCEFVIRDKETGEIYEVEKPDEFIEVSKVYRYGMKLRGFSIGCQPMDGLVGRMDDTAGKYYDILVYDKPLSQEEINEYELDDLN